MLTLRKNSSMWTVTTVAGFLLLLLLLVAHRAESRFGGAAASGSGHYTVGVNVYVDKTGVAKWRQVTGKSSAWNLKQEIKSTIVEVSHIFNSLAKHHLNIQVEAKDINVLRKDFLYSAKGKIEASKLHSSFETYAKYNYNNRLQHTEVNVLFTGYNMFSGKDLSTHGYSRYRGVCKASKTIVLELTGTYIDALTLARELGHVMGAKRTCKGHVMSIDYDHVTPNKYTFSSCAAMSMVDTATRRKCLRRPESMVRAVTGPRFGEFMDVDTVCRRHFGKNSYMPRPLYAAKGGDICLGLPCQKSWREISTVPTPPGLRCAQNKHCMEGQCVAIMPTNTNANTDTNKTAKLCPFGDQPTLGGRRGRETCSDISASDCGQNKWKRICCQKCDQTDQASADAFCRKQVGPHSALKRMSYNSYGHRLCQKVACLTEFKGRRILSRTFPAPDGLACAKNRRCQRGRCVSTKDGNPHISDSCPFGDQPWLGGRYQKDCQTVAKQRECRVWRQACCLTCSRY